MHAWENDPCRFICPGFRRPKRQPRDRHPLTAQANITPFVASQKVTRFVVTEISTQLLADTPELVVGERLCWSVPVMLTSPSRGIVGKVGDILVDVTTGELLVDDENVRRITEMPVVSLSVPIVKSCSWTRVISIIGPSAAITSPFSSVWISRRLSSTIPFSTRLPSDHFERLPVGLGGQRLPCRLHSAQTVLRLRRRRPPMTISQFRMSTLVVPMPVSKPVPPSIKRCVRFGSLPPRADSDKRSLLAPRRA